MKPELDAELCSKFPNLYADRNGSPLDTLMCDGFRVNDGWFPLIRDLSEKLEAAILKLPEAERPKYRAMQVKQKFGPLRFYMTKSTDEMRADIQDAEFASLTICELCGALGERRESPRVQVLCDTCQAESETSGAP